MTSFCGMMILLVGGGALLLPEVGASSGALVVGQLLLLAGLLELVAATGRHKARVPASLAGIATLIAGGLFLARDETRFLPNITVMTFWLVLRVIALGFAAYEGRDAAIRRWTMIAAATDFVLAIILILGLPLASIIVALFGTTSQLVASFSSVLAISFLATGAMLLRIAGCEEEGES